LLKKNVENNQLSDVTLFNVALSDKKGNINFYPFGEKSEWNFGIGSTKFESKTDTQKISVDCVVLSDYIKNEIVDYIKMDIEGAESDVIKELVKTGTLKNVKQFAIEFHDPIKKSALGSFLSLFELENFQYKVDLGKFGRDLQFYLIQCYKENNPD
jgi:FkbM family methyltransferase